MSHRSLISTTVLLRIAERIGWVPKPPLCCGTSISTIISRGASSGTWSSFLLSKYSIMATNFVESLSTFIPNLITKQIFVVSKPKSKTIQATFLLSCVEITRRKEVVIHGPISTPSLKPLPALHVAPINRVVYSGSHNED
jgi:hypothetical protein